MVMLIRSGIAGCAKLLTRTLILLTVVTARLNRGCDGLRGDAL